MKRTALINRILPYAKYALVGLANTMVFSIVAFVLSHLGFHYTAYTAIGYIIAFTNSYIFNKRFTFKDTESHKLEKIALFIGLNLLNLGLVQLVQLIMIEIFGVMELIGVILGMAAYTLIGFYLNKKYVFRLTQSE